MTRGARLAIITGIIIAIAAGATIAAVSVTQGNPEPPINNTNSTNSEPRQIVVELNESIGIEAK